MNAQTPDSRILKFESIENARELGGLVVRDGRSVRHGCLLRTGNLSRASEEDARRLVEEFGLSDVVDFRFPAEEGKDPDIVLPGVTYHHLPTLPDIMIRGFSSGRGDNEQLSSQEFAAALVDWANKPLAQKLARQLYPTIVSDPKAQKYYGDFLHIVLDARGAVLWHCSQGKDRAGLAALFVLKCLGARMETILDDFEQSSISFAPQVAMLSELVARKGGGPLEHAFIQAMVGVSKVNLLAALKLVDSSYGGLDAYIVEHLGFSEEEQKQLREKYLE